MSPKLKLLQRSVLRQTPEQAPAPEAPGVGAAIERMIADEVERRVGEAVERKPPAQVQRVIDQFDAPKPVTDYRQLPPTPRAPAPKAMETQFMRDALGRVNKISVGNLHFYVQRNELGQVVRMVPDDNGAFPPAIPPAEINRGA
ncbi:hypothetical protein [Pseudomonas fluorescens]|uniref:hypothetical protein n=1 Tax=Pseudomonas fluorescens TaxID=294 RepID=UPI00177D209F|nr:hypothetical protein [Pseudomonas fluorescens]